jgi:predicted dehydrogenase/threonine dehydrogenase-like Zn-dependent dehydrogenase
MKQLIQNSRSGKILIKNVPNPHCGENGVLVKTFHSVISTGTERLSAKTAKSSLMGKAMLRPDLVEKVYSFYKKNGLKSTYNLVKDRLDLPMPLGYSCSGEIIEVGKNVIGYRVGDIVACGGGGYALHSDINFIPQNLITKVDPSIDSHSAAYTTVGAIAMQGIRQADISPGSNIVVLGLGLVGQLTKQILKASGCTVFGVDINDFALKYCSDNEPWSLDYRFNAKDKDIVNKIIDCTNGYGADSVIITASSSDNKPLILAGELLRDKGTVVIVGGINVNIPRSPFYEKEAEIKFSRSYGPGRYDTNYEEKGIDYPIGHVRWTENRNMQSFLNLINSKRIDPKSLTSKLFSLEKAIEAFDLILNPSENFMGLVIEYDKETNVRDGNNSYFNKSIVNRTIKKFNGEIKIAVLGLGNFTQSFLMPHIIKRNDVDLIQVCNSRGMSASHAMVKYGFLECNTDSKYIIRSSKNNTVFITTKHDSHSSMIVEAIKSNKNIYVEKPIAINRNQFDNILEELNEDYSSIFHVGYNRRFSLISYKVKKILNNRTRPLSILYRVNAGFLPKNHWLHDKEIGGGRIIGEVCHFIDYAIFLTESKIISHSSKRLISDNSSLNNTDNLHINLIFEDGSVATIIYCNDGSTVLSKEYIEIHAESKSVVIDDFYKSTLYDNGKKFKLNNRGQDKGYSNQINQFFHAINNKNTQLIGLEDILHGMDITLSIDEKINKNE